MSVDGPGYCPAPSSAPHPETSVCMVPVYPGPYTSWAQDPAYYHYYHATAQPDYTNNNTHCE